MQYTRSSKIYFKKWLTDKKKNDIQMILSEYSTIVNWFIDKFFDSIPQLTKYDLICKENVNLCKSETGTWLTYRMITEAFWEGYSMVKIVKSNNSQTKPFHRGNRACLSQRINIQSDAVSTKNFDFNVRLMSIGKRLSISIPLKKHCQFNKWDMLGERNKTIILTKNYIQFSFTLDIDKKKKPDGNFLGIDIGVNRLITTSQNNCYGENYREYIEILHRKKRGSKAYRRKKREIVDYINTEIKKIDFYNTTLIVCEKLSNLKYKMKVKRRLTKNIRRLISDWNYRQVLTRIQAHCEENRVAFRSVSAYYTSQICSSCGYRDQKNRVSQESFVCRECGHTDNADYNASKNILNRFITGQFGACFKSHIVEG